MKTKLMILTMTLLSVGLLTQPSAMAIRLNIEVGDRGFYTDGPSYWDNGYEWVWIPGSWGEHHKWMHGRYERRGEFHREHAGEHHHPH